jgi:hypothetical protein
MDALGRHLDAATLDRRHSRVADDVIERHHAHGTRGLLHHPLAFRVVDRLDLLLVVEICDRRPMTQQCEALFIEGQLVDHWPRVANGNLMGLALAGPDGRSQRRLVIVCDRLLGHQNEKVQRRYDAL